MPQQNSIRNSHDSKDEQKERLANVIQQVHIMLQQQGSSNDQMIKRNNQNVDQNNTEKVGNEGENKEAVMNDQINASSTDINEDLGDSEADKDDHQDDPINTDTADGDLGDSEEDKDNDGQNPSNTENNGDSGDSETDENSNEGYLDFFWHDSNLTGGTHSHYQPFWSDNTLLGGTNRPYGPSWNENINGDLNPSDDEDLNSTDTSPEVRMFMNEVRNSQTANSSCLMNGLGEQINIDGIQFERVFDHRHRNCRDI
jgi:hypothetical protein